MYLTHEVRLTPKGPYSRTSKIHQHSDSERKRQTNESRWFVTLATTTIKRRQTNHADSLHSPPPQARPKAEYWCYWMILLRPLLLLTPLPLIQLFVSNFIHSILDMWLMCRQSNTRLHRRKWQTAQCTKLHHQWQANLRQSYLACDKTLPLALTCW